jgi:SAM-dependent methyltransferase
VSVSTRPPVRPAVMWHDVECGTYAADLPLWRRLAREADGPVLDVGAGTGRVALELARAGRRVTALDLDAELLAALSERAASAGVDVSVVHADARDFVIPGAAFALIAVPMQTIQLLPDAPARARFFASARRALAAGGRVALALAETPAPFEEPGALPAADVGDAGGWRFVSQPLAIRLGPDTWTIERARHLVAPDGSRVIENDRIELAALTAGGLAAEGVAAGLAAEPPEHVAETEDHVGSEVVILRG